MAGVKIAGFEVGCAVRAADGFAAGGDAVVARCVGDQLVLGVIDVLGHGPHAHALAVMAEALLSASQSNDAGALLSALDEALTGSIGAAAAVVVIQPESGSGRFVAVGNTVARVVGRSERRLVSMDGIVGHSHRAPRPVEFVLGVGDLLLLHTDGISSRFERSEYPQLRTEDVEVSARELIRRFGKTYDDAACIVARRASP
jgi:serine phosphatase RsbU (regulator of sigma subunit)